jgi:hypothetical protein
MILPRLLLCGVVSGMSAGEVVSQGTPVAPADTAAVRRSVEQLRQHKGRWIVETEFLNPDKTVARRAVGSYRFDWAREDQILVGVSEIPALGTAAGILFFVSPQRGVTEMLSVGNDGRVWTMTGALGGEERETQVFPTQGGGEARMRFTRFNVHPDSFESRMEYSEDGGKTWLPGNHQTFRRAPDPGVLLKRPGT